MSDFPPFRRSYTGGPLGRVTFSEAKPKPPEGPCESVVIKRLNIEPGAVEEINVCKEIEWVFGTRFKAEHMIFVGSSDMWILQYSLLYGGYIFGCDVPCDSFRPGCPTQVNWRQFSCFDDCFKLMVKNCGSKRGDFIVRLAGRFEEH